MKSWLKICLLFLSPLVLTQCYLFKKTSEASFKVRLINEQVFKHNRLVGKFQLGGLSSLSFDIKTNKFFALSDDKKNHRIYKFSLIKKGKDAYNFKLENHILLHSSKGKKLPFNMDPEGLDIARNKDFYIASEGQQIFKKPDPPQIFRFNSQGLWKSSWPTPSVFWDETKISTFGAQENKGFESLTIDYKSNTLWVATENPLLQDLKNQKKNWIRLSEFSIGNKKLISQYAYSLYNTAGLTEVILLKNKTFLTLERSYNEKKESNLILLFFANCQKARNIVNQKDLKNLTPCSKKLLWSSNKKRNLRIGNLEGMALGPSIDSQSQILVLISDNNFNPKQKNQVLFFELKKSY